MKRLAPGLQRWTARHPDWHPADAFGAEVASFALVAGDALLLVDPLLPDGDAADQVLQQLDALARAAAATSILITIGYHVRSAAALSARYGATVHGPAQAGKRLDEGTPFALLAPGTPGPGGAVAHAIGKPRRGETPLWLPSHKAIAFGDALVATPEGALRMWCQEPLDDRRRAFYRDRFAPTLAPLAAREPRRILPTHGPPILAGGAAALRAAAADEPWAHRG
jgi:hypothetical protein